jgi:DNA-binding NarL/FixJ family response regulator
VTAPIRVLIADDAALVRGSFRLLVDSTAGMQTVGEAANGREAVELATGTCPDVVLMDVRMPEMDGIEATRHICAARAPGRGPRVLVLTTFDLDEYVYGALRAGASGFMLKDAPPLDLLNAIRTVAAGDGLLAPAVTGRVIAEYARNPPPGQPVGREVAALTDREREVLRLIARGLNNLEIGDHLALRPPTVKTHVGHLLAKLNARDRAQLVIAAYESGLVTPAPS